MAYRRVLFLDTCSFHHMRLYYDFAVKHRLKPLGRRRVNPITGIKQKFLTSRTAKDLEYGYKLLMYLKAECLKGSEIQFAPLTKIEMSCGMLRGKAIIKMAENLAPNRMFSRIDENEVLKLLVATDYDKISKAINKILNSFQALGINISEVDSEKSKEAYLIAQELLTKLYFDVVDIMIYAYAFVVQADELLTQDGYFVKIANGIENPGALQTGLPTNQFRIAKSILSKKLGSLIGISASSIKFPKIKNV